MTQPRVVTDKEAQRILADHYANQRALARRNAPTTQCIHDMVHAYCVICMGQDPHIPVVNKSTGETEMLPVNEVVPTRNGARGYENRTRNAIFRDGVAWTLQHEQRRGV